MGRHRIPRSVRNAGVRPPSLSVGATTASEPAAPDELGAEPLPMDECEGDDIFDQENAVTPSDPEAPSTPENGAASTTPPPTAAPPDGSAAPAPSGESGPPPSAAPPGPAPDPPAPTASRRARRTIFFADEDDFFDAMGV